MIKIFDLIGRIFISGIFLLSGFNKIGNYDEKFYYAQDYKLMSDLVNDNKKVKILKEQWQKI